MRRSLCFVLFLLGSACSRNSPPPFTDSGSVLDHGGEAEVGIIDVGPADVSSPCSVEVVGDWPFADQLAWAKPNSPPLHGELTKADFANEFEGQSVPFRALTRGFAPHLQPGVDLPIYALWASDDDSFKVSFYIVNKLESLEDHRVYLSVLVDYVPVTAGYVRWTEDRGGEAERANGTGLAFDIRSERELFDVEVPAEVFSESRAYEVSVLLTFGRPGHKYVEASARYALFHEGYEWPEMPCFSEAVALPLNAKENGIANNIVMAFKDAFVRAPGVDAPDKVHRPIEASPGEIIDLEISLFNQHTDWVTTAAAVPFLEGKPVGDAWFYRLYPDPTNSSFTIARRENFQLQLPEEPGTYDFHVGIWRDAMLPAQEPDRRPHLHNGNEVESAGTSVSGSSNLVRFIVE